ncbi:hypothetical protein JCM14469_02010 [Desulfatiferula olefinivorans]
MIPKVPIARAMILILLAASAVSAAPRSARHRFGTPAEGPSQRLAVGIQGHTDIEAFTDRPLSNGDLSGTLFYEYHEGIGLWQIGAAYAPSADHADEVFTPQISLILKDRIYRMGTGALISYVKQDGDRDWTDVYWQILAGLSIPLGKRFSVDVYGHYVFEAWDEITDSDRGGLEYSALLSVSF